MIIPAAVIGGILLGGYLWRRYNLKIARTTLPVSNAAGIIMKGKEQNPAADTIPWPPESTWQRLNIDGTEYLVSPTYIAPIGIGEAVDMVKEHGLVLPTPKMVDAIWQASDLKIEPTPMKHDGTLTTMNSKELADKHRESIQAQITGKEFKLLGGSHKDVVYIDRPYGKIVNKPGIYGWHKTDGRIIQAPMWGHALAWKDYSQGLRLIRRVG